MERNSKTDENMLQQFNSKYKTNLTIDTTKIDVFSCNIFDKGLSELCSIHFPSKIEKLILEENGISNITPLSLISFGSNLISLDLKFK